LMFPTLHQHVYKTIPSLSSSSISLLYLMKNLECIFLIVLQNIGWTHTCNCKKIFVVDPINIFHISINSLNYTIFNTIIEANKIIGTYFQQFSTIDRIS
jgi:hypothetical protein